MELWQIAVFVGLGAVYVGWTILSRRAEAAREAEKSQARTKTPD